MENTDLELTIDAIDEWGRRITLNESFDESTFNALGMLDNGSFDKVWIARYLSKVHPNLVYFRIAKINKPWYDSSTFSDDDTYLNADIKYEEWDGGNKKLAKLFKFPKKVEWKNGYEIPKGSFPFEHKIGHLFDYSYKKYLKKKEVQQVDGYKLNDYTFFNTTRKISVSWTSLKKMYPDIDFSDLEGNYNE